MNNKATQLSFVVAVSRTHQACFARINSWCSTHQESYSLWVNTIRLGVGVGGGWVMFRRGYEILRVERGSRKNLISLILKQVQGVWEEFLFQVEPSIIYIYTIKCGTVYTLPTQNTTFISLLFIFRFVFISYLTITAVLCCSRSPNTPLNWTARGI